MIVLVVAMLAWATAIVASGATALVWFIVDRIQRRRSVPRGIAAAEEFLAGAWEAGEERWA